MNTSWHSYPKVFAIGHRAVQDLFLDPVVVQEKVDGSQISFGTFDGVLKIRSKGAEIVPDAPEKMFAKGVETIAAIAPLLTGGWTYSGEYIRTPKHNVLAYDRVPRGHIVLFDVRYGDEQYHTPHDVMVEAERLGLEVVPTLFEGVIDSPEKLVVLLETQSILGGQKIEGVVVKNYKRFGEDKKALMGKYVSEAFKEVHKGEWRAANPTKADVVQSIIAGLRTPARWQKAVQHLRDRGELLGEPRDIGALIKEVQEDTISECEAEIKELLYRWAKPNILRGIVGGLPQWYKDELMKKQFDGTADVR